MRLRKERLGNGNGRRYHILFTATADIGTDASSRREGEVTLCVPKNQGMGNVNGERFIRARSTVHECNCAWRLSISLKNLCLVLTFLSLHK